MGARFHSNNFKQWRLNDDKWQDSDFIPRLLEIFEKLKTFMVILLTVKNDAYSRILSA